MKSSTASRIAGFGVALSLCLRAGLALAQQPSLAELAQKEQARKKGLKAAPSKVYSDKDLPKSSAPPSVASTVPATTPVPAEQKPAEQKPAEEKKEEKDETYWRNRVAQAREALRRAQAFADALQSRINALSTDVVNRDDPYQRAKLADDRLKALAELQRVQGEIEQSKKAVVDIEEEARQAGVPPGWLR